MTREQVTDLLEELLKAYPYYMKNISDPDGMIDTWEREFGTEDAGAIFKAARHHINTSKWFPTISEIRKAINKGQMMYGQPQPSAPAIEAPKAPRKLIKTEEEKCKFERCVLYHDLCNGLDDNGKCPFEGL
jgi:hypothetical protein